MKSLHLLVLLLDLCTNLSFKLKISKSRIKIEIIMKKKQIFKVILTVVKYGITLILGYLGGSDETVNTVVNGIM